MSTRKTHTGVRVRGTCRDGHTTEARSNPGRVTWSGPCSTPGCEHQITARRVPADTPPPPADTKVAGEQTDPYAVEEIKSYGTAKQPHRRPVEPVRPVEPEPAGEPKRAPDVRDPEPDERPERPAGPLAFRRRERRGPARPERRLPDFLEGILG